MKLYNLFNTVKGTFENLWLTFDQNNVMVYFLCLWYTCRLNPETKIKVNFSLSKIKKKFEKNF